MNFTSKIVVALMLALVWTSSSFGQGSASGDLHVTVRDQKGGVVTNATVTAAEQNKAFVRATNLNTEGVYRLVSLPPGVYTVTVEAPGFSKAEAKDQSVTVGQSKDLPITLSVSGVETVVNVNSEAAAGRDHAQFNNQHDRSAAHRQSADQRTQLHQFRADRFAGGA